MKGETARRLRSVREGMHGAWRFVSEDIWDVEIGSLSMLRRTGVNALRVVHLVFRGFREDECPLHASALTFNTLMAVVPILALSLSLARVFGGAELAQANIRGVISEWTQTFQRSVSTDAESFAGQGVSGEDVGLSPEALAMQINDMVDNAFTAVEKISFTALGSIGLVLLLWMVISVLGRVEASFNRVWGVAVGRTFWRKFTDYLSVLLILPFLVTAALSLPIADMTTQVLDESAAEGLLALFQSDALRILTTILFTSLAFTFVIMFMPNTRVKFRSGFAGGFVSGVLFLLWLWVCAAIQVGVARYGKLYGSFAVVPILLAWVYVSWEIVLFGAEVAFAVQNCTTYRMEQGSGQASVEARLLLALSVLAEAGRAMSGGKGPFAARAYAAQRRIPVRFLNGMVDELAQAGLLAAVADANDAWVLLRAPASIHIQDVVDVVLRSGVRPDALGLESIDPAVRDVVDAADATTREVLEKRTLQDVLAAM
jgi:membrane protein